MKNEYRSIVIKRDLICRQKMLRPLPAEVVQKLRSGVAITSVVHCVEELVANSIDAHATCIAVRLNLPFFKIQVIDNGDGIDCNQMEFIGTRYATSKCHSLDDLDNLRTIGFRGEALASLKDVSSVLVVESRSAHSKKTYCKIFTCDKSPKIQKACINRPSKGTTVTVHDFLYNLPVRKQCISAALDLEDCRKSLEKLALIHSEISFSLRNDATGEICLETRKSSSTRAAFAFLFGQERTLNLKEMSFVKGSYKVSGLISTDGHASKELQLVYINKRFIHRSKLQKLVNAILKKVLLSHQKYKGSTDAASPYSPSKFQSRHAVFALNITCPRDEYDFIREPRKTLVEFTDWESVLKVMEEAVFKFLKDNGLWSMNDNIADFSTGNSTSVTDSTLNVSCNFPFDVGKDISATDYKHGLFSIPVKRATMNQNDDSIISPSHKVCIVEKSNQIFVGKSKVDQNKYLESSEKSSYANEPKTPKCQKSLLKNFQNITDSSNKSNSEPQIFSFNGFNIPDSSVSLKKITTLLEDRSKAMSNDQNKKTQKEKATSISLKHFAYSANKQPPKSESHQKSEATQTKKPLSLNTAAKQIKKQKNVSKYDFGHAPYLGSLQRLKRTAVSTTQALPAIAMHKHQKKVPVVNETYVPHKNYENGKILKNTYESEIQNRNNFVCLDKVREGHILQKSRHQSKEYNHSQLEKAHSKISTDIMKSTKDSRFNYNSQCSDFSRVPVVSHLKKEERNLEKVKKPSRTCGPASLLFSKDSFKQLSIRNPLSSVDEILSQTEKENQGIQRSRSFPEYDLSSMAKQSPKSWFENRYRSRLTDFSDKPALNSSFLFSSRENIDATQNENFAKCSSPNCTISTRSKSLEFDSGSSLCCFIDYMRPSHAFFSSTTQPFDVDHEQISGSSNCYKKHSPLKSHAMATISHVLDAELISSRSQSNVLLPKEKNSDALSFKLHEPFQKETSFNKTQKRLWKEASDSPISDIQSFDESPSLFLPSPPDCIFLRKPKHLDSTKFNSRSLGIHGSEHEQKLVSFSPVPELNSNLSKQEDKISNEINQHSENSSTIVAISQPISKVISNVEKGENISKHPLKSAYNASCVSEKFPEVRQPVSLDNGQCSSGNVISEVDNHLISILGPTTHKKTFIHKNSRNPSFFPPPSINRTDCTDGSMQDALKTDYLTVPSKIHRSHFFTANETSIALPKPLAEKEKPSPVTGNSLPVDSHLESDLQNHFEQLETSDWSVKWNAAPPDVADSAVEDLFCRWENPIFKQSVMEVESLSFAAPVQNTTKMYGILNSYRFSKKAFSTLQVIGQVDQKFIACLVNDVNEDVKGKRLLVLFDQHAAHERVRLEELMEEFYDTSKVGDKSVISTALSSPLDIHLNAKEARLVTAYSGYLNRFGISVIQGDNEMTFQVCSVPGCLLERANNELKRNRLLAISSLVESIIREWITLLEQTRSPATVLPKTLLGILNAQACRGAIKFGDPLDGSQCVNLLETLSCCNLPFQCAHGRPSLAPLLDLSKIDVQRKRSPPQLKNLSRLMKEGVISQNL